MVKINELSADLNPQNFNQMTRWVNTKEEHANKIIHLAADYSLAQRVKPFGSAGKIIFFSFFLFFTFYYFSRARNTVACCFVVCLCVCFLVCCFFHVHEALTIIIMSLFPLSSFFSFFLFLPLSSSFFLLPSSFSFSVFSFLLLLSSFYFLL